MSALMLQERAAEKVNTRGREFIPLAETVLNGNEKRYVLDCLDTGWISGSGKYVDDFEREFATFCGVEHAVSVSSGTAGLHVALLALGVAPGDEVIVPDLTYVASANAVTYCGARPVFADVDPTTWTLDPLDVARKISPATKAIMPVHLYGHPADIDPLLELASAHNLSVIEDAAEAHGAEYKGRRVGGLGDVGVFSFFGNKIIATGEGGMITTDDKSLADQVRLLKGQGMDTARRYWFPIVGYNYRMTNIQAAIGLAQLERINWFIEKKREVAALYDEAMRSLPILTSHEAAWAKSVYWLYSVCLTEEYDRDRIMTRLLEQGIETRPFFHPMHHLPPYYQRDGDSTLPVTTNLAARGINLPSSALLTREDITYVTSALRACLC
ncbi:MAG: DegT/DnrJ/EryC1/StrS family aminotransferase [Acidobacteria bacterium]|nr:DegT/DnrJ/EryC1/StrS family aminotransferase [Acidobacteriota bacterium]